MTDTTEKDDNVKGSKGSYLSPVTRGWFHVLHTFKEVDFRFSIRYIYLLPCQILI